MHDVDMSELPTGVQPEITPPPKKRYECRWRDDGSGKQVHYWVDNEPDVPHWPESAVMRWDLRPNDWDVIWPETIDHPCAKLFAPRHPDRPGAKRFRDWVESWPAGFNWRSELPEHLHSAVVKAFTEISQGPAKAAPPAPAPEVPALTAAALVEQLAVAMLDVPDADRPAVAKALSTLGLAPDSSRTIEALKRLLR